jgi:pimeloyl-ACP methyl ester carboxylesterase
MPLQTDVKGEGLPLVFVGGGLTGWLSWVTHQERLAPTRKVVRVQPLSVQYGLENRPLPPNYGIKMECGALADSIAELGLPRPLDLVAWSYGAAITLDYALGHPERIRTLVLIEPPAFWVLEATGRLDAESKRQWDEMRALYAGMTQDVTEDQLASFVREAGLCPPDKSPRDLPQWPSWVEHRRSLRVGIEPWNYHDTAARLHAFHRPVLLVKGTGSSHFLHQIIDGLGSALPKSEVVEFPGGHAPQIASMDAFLSKLAAFEATAQ